MPTVISKYSPKTRKDMAAVIQEAIKQGYENHVGGYDSINGIIYGYKKSESLQNTKIKCFYNLTNNLLKRFNLAKACHNSRHQAPYFTFKEASEKFKSIARSAQKTNNMTLPNRENSNYVRPLFDVKKRHIAPSTPPALDIEEKARLEKEFKALSLG